MAKKRTDRQYPKPHGLNAAELQAPIPAAFFARMERLLGDEYQAFRATLDLPPRAGLRANTLKISPDELARLAPWPLEPLPWPPGAFLVPGDGAATGSPESGAQPGVHPYHAAGLYYLQDPSAMVPAALLDPQPGEHVLDLSAAPGGKATHLASLLGGSGLLVANEIHPQRAWDLAENLERWGVRNAAILNETPERIAAAFPEFFDRVLVDAPCSGEGMFRKSGAARRDWTPQLVEGCAARQAGILHAAAATLRPGGILAYVTCTFAPEEDEGVVGGFLAGHPDFTLIAAPGHPGFAPGRPDWLSAGSHMKANLSDAVRVWPHLYPGEGQFVALLRKSQNIETRNIETTETTDGATDARSDLSRIAHGSGPGRRAAPRGPARPGAQHAVSPRAFPLARPLRNQYLAFCADHLSGVPAEERLALAGSYLYQIPAGLEEAELTAVRAIHPGWWLGAFKKERFEPSHGLALALRADEARRSVDLAPDGPEVSAYLRGETVRTPGEDGWVLITVSGHSLGWARRVGGILKSHYPRGLRRH